MGLLKFFVGFLVLYLRFKFLQSAGRYHYCVINSFILLFKEITAQPVSINATLNSTVDIVCEGTGDLLAFLVDSLPANRDEIRTRGFDDDVFRIGGEIMRAVLTAKAYDINNNTNISCVATTISPSSSVTSDTVFLTIQG